MHIRLVEERAAWEALVGALPRGNILQSFGWGEFKACYGWRPYRLVVEREDQPVAGAQMLLRRSPLGTLAYVPRGPMLDFGDREATDLLFASLHRQAREAGAFFLKVEPDLPSSAGRGDDLRGRGFHAGTAVQPHSTIVVDLAADPATMLGRLSPRTRYNIRLAERRQLRVCRGGDADLPGFYRLLVETAGRGGFAVHPYQYYRDLWRIFSPGNKVHLVLVEDGDQPVAATMFLTHGGMAYQFYSGSASRGRSLKPNELLQWSALLAARELGCLAYDLWGIPDEVGRLLEAGESAGRPPRLYEERVAAGTMGGVYLFKRGFGGKVARTAGAYDYIYDGARYWLWTRAVPAARRAALWAGRPRGVSRGGAVSERMEAYEA